MKIIIHLYLWMCISQMSIAQTKLVQRMWVPSGHYSISKEIEYIPAYCIDHDGKAPGYADFMSHSSKYIKVTRLKDGSVKNLEDAGDWISIHGFSSAQYLVIEKIEPSEFTIDVDTLTLLWTERMNIFQDSALLQSRHEVFKEIESLIKNIDSVWRYTPFIHQILNVAILCCTWQLKNRAAADSNILSLIYFINAKYLNHTGLDMMWLVLLQEIIGQITNKWVFDQQVLSAAQNNMRRRLVPDLIFYLNKYKSFTIKNGIDSTWLTRAIYKRINTIENIADISLRSQSKRALARNGVGAGNSRPPAGPTLIHFDDRDEFFEFLENSELCSIEICIKDTVISASIECENEDRTTTEFEVSSNGEATFFFNQQRISIGYKFGEAKHESQKTKSKLSADYDTAKKFIDGIKTVKSSAIVKPQEFVQLVNYAKEKKNTGCKASVELCLKAGKHGSELEGKLELECGNKKLTIKSSGNIEYSIDSENQSISIKY